VHGITSVTPVFCCVTVIASLFTCCQPMRMTSPRQFRSQSDFGRGPGPFWGGVAAGVVTGAIVGSAIASRPYYPYGYYGYYAPPPPPPCPLVWNGYAWVSGCY
jgi:hypothetical protein